MKFICALIAVFIYLFIILFGWMLGWDKYEFKEENRERFYDD
jgi:hypothetical protein